MLPIAKEGINLIAVFLIMTLIAILSKLWMAGIILFVLSLFLLFFFRDPIRKNNLPPHLITSPADGRILSIEEVEEKSYLNDRVLKISIFLSLLNVHVTRIPIDGEVENIDYKKGQFLPSFLSGASDLNEQNTIFMKNKEIKFIIKQIAGIIARRIVCSVKPKEAKKRGEKLGMIKLGSRVELYIPKSVNLKIKVGQKVKGGITLIGELKA